MKDSGNRRFRYPLDPFLRKKKLDWSSVKLEEARARSVVDMRKQKAASVQSEIEALEQSRRQSLGRGAVIDRDQQQNISNYLKHTQRGLEQIHQQLDQANTVHQQISRELSTIHQGIKALEKHKTHKQLEHSQEARRREYNQLDELWLAGAGSAAAASANLISPKRNPRSPRPHGRGGKHGR